VRSHLIIVVAGGGEKEREGEREKYESLCV
jgi:hypothetical protein